MVMINVTYRLGELFSGPGGIALGAKSAQVTVNNITYSISHAWATDYDKDSCETYRHNICPDNPKSVVCRDIRELDIEKLGEISSIDALAFGFPCNDFSVLGKRKGLNGEYGPLYTYGVKTLNIFKPQWFLAENVGGLKSSNNGKDFDFILRDLENAGEGYNLTAHLYKFEQYGIPQARHRVIIVGIRKDLGKLFRVPSPEPYSNIDVSCRSAIENPPIPLEAHNHELPRHSEKVIERLKYIKPGENAFTADIPEHLRLNVRSVKISQTYKRLNPNKPSHTVTGGGGSRVCHWSENRALTNRELARLQTFPDDFVFYGSKESVRKQIGMAVPPRAAKIIFEAILNCLAGSD